MAVTGEIRDGLFVARNVELEDRSDHTIKAKAYDKAGNFAWADDSTRVKLDKGVDIQFTFDANGNVTKKEQTFTYDAGGGGETQTAWYFYTPDNMLEYIDLPGDENDRHYVYDGLGRRVIVETGDVTVDGQGNFVSFDKTDSLTKKFVYLGGSVIRQLDNSDDVEKEYIRGLELGGGIGGIIYQRMIPEEGPDKYYYYHYNHKGDVSALTDGDEKLAAYYEYDAWGNTMTEAEVSGVDNPYRYSTKEWDEKSGLYYFGARYYYPEAGRWTQRDPLGTVDGLNLYLYVDGEPVSRVDPAGRFALNVHFWKTGSWARDAMTTNTQGGCVTFKRGAPSRIARSNIWTDVAHKNDRKFHLDDPRTLGDDRRRIAEAYFAYAIDRARGGDCADAYMYLGRALHAVQDIYAHRANWPYDEKGNKLPKSKWHPPGTDSWRNKSEKTKAKVYAETMDYLYGFLTAKCNKCVKECD